MLIGLSQIGRTHGRLLRFLKRTTDSEFPKTKDVIPKWQIFLMWCNNVLHYSFAMTILQGRLAEDLPVCVFSGHSLPITAEKWSWLSRSTCLFVCKNKYTNPDLGSSKPSRKSLKTRRSAIFLTLDGCNFAYTQYFFHKTRWNNFNLKWVETEEQQKSQMCTTLKRTPSVGPSQ